MMEIELRKLATDLSGVTANWGISPTNALLPQIRIQLIHEAGTYSMSGRDKLKQASIQMDVFTSNFADSLRLRNLIVSGLENYRGTETSSIQNIFLDRQRQLDDLTDLKNPVYRQSLDWTVFYE